MITNTGTIIYDTLKSFVNNRVYPLVAELGTQKPFIVYKTETFEPDTTKDGIVEWVYKMQVSIVDDKYDSCFELSKEVLSELENIVGIMYDLSIDSISEDYIDDAYVRDINITIKI